MTNDLSRPWASQKNPRPQSFRRWCLRGSFTESLWQPGSTQYTVKDLTRETGSLMVPCQPFSDPMGLVRDTVLLTPLGPGSGPDLHPSKKGWVWSNDYVLPFSQNLSLSVSQMMSLKLRIPFPFRYGTSTSYSRLCP